jgi:hypothetical protein
MYIELKELLLEIKRSNKTGKTYLARHTKKQVEGLFLPVRSAFLVKKLTNKLTSTETPFFSSSSHFLCSLIHLFLFFPLSYP